MARKVNLDAGVVGMGSGDSYDPIMEIATGENIKGYDGGFDSEVADEDILRDEKTGKKLYVRVTHRIDRKMVKAGYVPLTPAICEICGTKLVKNYSKLTPMQKEAVKVKLKDHKAAVHRLSNATIIDEDAMKEDRSWLGMGRQ